MISWYKTYRGWLSVAVRYLIGLLIIAWLMHADLINLKVLSLINLRVAIVASILISIQVLLAGWRVQLLLAAHGIQFGAWRCIAFNSVGIFYSLFLPGGMSGDLARAYCFWRASPAASKSALFGALFLDCFFVTLALIFI